MSTSTALAAFAEHLRGCRRLAGEPSLRELERLTRQAGRPYPRATIDDKLQGRTVPDWGFVAAFVAACHRNAGGTGDLDLAHWRREHVRMLADLARHREERRRPPAEDQGPLAVTVKLHDVGYVITRGPDGPEEVPGSGHRVRLIVEAPSMPAVVLDALRPVVLARREPSGDFNPHLGSLRVRQFDLFLDEPEPRLRRPDGGDDFPFKVSPADPEVFDLVVHTQTGDIEWVLDLDWTCAGRSGVRRIDLGGHPFRTIAH
ncbi:hypothetical protein [Dactylosporangium sp. NPDC005555]|uniref:hypothetical protein n=1 Tax=Dactylosporangium sp. NPDC005555 TaxID=3154889 RepID=UPI0033B7AD56